MRRSVLFVLAVLSAACGQSGAQQQTAGGPPPAMPVKIVTLAATQIRDTTEYIGVVRSHRSITVQPQVEGQLLKIFVKSGDVVEEGKPLMQIDPARQAASVSTVQANRQARLAALAYAKQQLERVQRLYNEDAVSKQELDQAKSNVDAAQAEVEALGAQIRQNVVQLDYYRIVAPAQGVVGDIPVRVGDHVTPQTVLTTLDNNAALESYISVPVERAADLRPDMEVQLIDNSGATIATGKVRFISPQVSPGTQSILIKTDVANEQGTLRSEQFVRARVVWSSHEGVTIPALAVLRMNGQTFVYAAEAGQGGAMVAKMRPVALGDLVDNVYIVKSGLKVGDKIIAGGIEKLRDGAPVQELPPQPPPGQQPQQQAQQKP